MFIAGVNFQQKAQQVRLSTVVNSRGHSDFKSIIQIAGNLPPSA